MAPTYFYENLGDPRRLIAEGELAIPLSSSKPLQQIALADLGSAVASLLARQDEFLGQRVELAGDEPTPLEMAEALSAAGRRPVRYRQVDISAVAARSADLSAMYRFLTDTGYQVEIAAVRSRFSGLTWTTFSSWVAAATRTSR